MSFFFETITIPFWFIFFVIASAAPLWLKWIKSFHKKYIASGILQKKFRRAKSDDEMVDSIFKKASDHINENSELSGFSEAKPKKRKSKKKRIDPDKKQNIKVVLQVLAASGETGVLPKSISDKMNINSLETSNALKYLVEKEYAEVINGTTGEKYYLTDLGRRYCINKKIL